MEKVATGHSIGCLLRPPWAKPPTAAELSKAKWGIGGQGVWLRDGKVWPGSGHRWAAQAFVFGRRRKYLATLAKDGMLLDGGHSSSMAIGNGATGVSAGVLYGGWRPVATHFGVRARPIQVGK